MTTTSRLRRWQGNLRRLPGRTPLRVKMITALLALVIIALAVISVASLTVFRNYQIQRANQQVTELYQQEVMGLHAGHGVNAQVTAFGPYLIAIVPSGTSLARQAANQPGLPGGTPLPDVPTSGSLVQGPRRTPGHRRLRCPAATTGRSSPSSSPVVSHELLRPGPDRATPP